MAPPVRRANQRRVVRVRAAVAATPDVDEPEEAEDEPEAEPEAAPVKPTRKANARVVRPGDRESAGTSGNRAKAPSFTIHNPAAFVGDRKLKVLFFGDMGVGKTTLAASAILVPTMNDVLFIDAEAGETTLTGMEGLDVVTINTYKQLARIYEFLRLHVRLIAEGKRAEALEHQQAFFDAEKLKDPNRLRVYQTVVIDSLSEVQKYLMYQLLNINLGQDQLDIEPEVASQRDWLASADMIRLLIRYMRDLPLHVIIVCAEDIDEDTAKLVPKLPGKLAKEIPGFMDIVGYYLRTKTADGWVRRLYLASGYPKWKSKHRFRNLPDLESVDNPTMLTLVELDRKDASYNVTRSASTEQAKRRSPSRTESRTGTQGATRAGTGGRRV